MSSDRIMAEEPIEKKITRILIHRKMTVTAAESCTGGLVAGTLVNADGISEVFKESYVTYSNEAKHKQRERMPLLLQQELQVQEGEQKKNR